jgi:ABC-type lipoprotein export system ATPase subunit
VVLPPLLDGVDLEVADGEVVALDGDDGCGTSTLLAVLAGRRTTSAGLVGGPVALLEQAPGNDWADSDVAGDLAAPEALVALGMRSPPERQMWMLSAGERQRVRLARALAAPPGVVLLLDEPLAALDPAGARTVLAALRGRTAVVVAKGDARVQAVADRVLVLADGRLSPAR